MASPIPTTIKTDPIDPLSIPTYVREKRALDNSARNIAA